MTNILFSGFVVYMKLLPVLTPYIKFTSDYKYDDLEENNNVHNFLIDDEESYSHDSHIRDAIRAHMYSRFLPSYGLETGRSNAYATSIEDVYAGRDVAPVGTSTAINAMGAGKRVAKAIIEKLK